jgi:hypothetical protein
MKSRNLITTSVFVVLVSIALAACGKQPGTVPEVTQTQFLPQPDDVRDFRHCEILPVFRSRATFTVEV